MKLIPLGIKIRYKKCRKIAQWAEGVEGTSQIAILGNYQYTDGLLPIFFITFPIRFNAQLN